MTIFSSIVASIVCAVVFTVLGRLIGSHIAKKQQRLTDMQRNGSKHV